MDKKTYNGIKAAVGAGIGILMARSLQSNSWALAAVGVITGMVIIYFAKTRVDEILYDERTSIVQQKAASVTLAISLFSMSIIGIGIVIAGNLGYDAPTPYGYFLAYLSLFIMAINGLFVWHYKNQMGG